MRLSSFFLATIDHIPWYHTLIKGVMLACNSNCTLLDRQLNTVSIWIYLSANQREAYKIHIRRSFFIG